MSVLVNTFNWLRTPAATLQVVAPDWREVWIAALYKVGNYQRVPCGLSNSEKCADGCGRRGSPVKPWLCERCRSARLEGFHRER